MTDEEAVRQCQMGYREAFRHIVDNYMDVLYGTAYLMTGSRAVAEDQVQEAFISAWKGMKGFHAGRPLKPWLVRILVNRVMTYRRSAASPTMPLWDDCAGIPAVKGPAEGVENRDQVYRALAALPDQHRQVILLRFFTGLSLAETSAVLGRRQGTVKSQQHRALEQLKQGLGDEDLQHERGST